MSPDCLQFAAEYAEVNAIAHDSASDDEVAGKMPWAFSRHRDLVSPPPRGEEVNSHCGKFVRSLHAECERLRELARALRESTGREDINNLRADVGTLASAIHQTADRIDPMRDFESERAADKAERNIESGKIGKRALKLIEQPAYKGSGEPQ